MASKPVLQKKGSKRDKIERVLIGLVEYYIKTAKAVGSNTLKDAGFEEFSSATLRNYFAELEEEGYVLQQHTSGGRVPTPRAFRFYANYCLEQDTPYMTNASHLGDLHTQDMKEILLFLQQTASLVAEKAGCATFLSAPRFDQDFVTNIKLIGIDETRLLAILITSFGQVYTEQLPVTQKNSMGSLKRIEEYLNARLTGKEDIRAEELTPDEFDQAVRFYQEAMTRYIVRYTNFTQEDLFRTGFSKLLRYPEFQEAESLTSSLSLFENDTALRALVRETIKSSAPKVWIGEDLFSYLTSPTNCASIAFPYQIAHKKVGAIGIIGPMRLPYKELFSLLKSCADDISQFLEKNLYKHKITFRTPAHKGYEIGEASRKLLTPPKDINLLEHQGNS